MITRHYILFLIFSLTVFLSIPGAYSQPSPFISFSGEECTIGVVSDRVTPDGRPLIWKVRDNIQEPLNEVAYHRKFPIKYICVISRGDSIAWMGVNEKGFAILNSNAPDLTGGNSGFTNGGLMTFALGTCATVAEFEQLLEITNEKGRRTHANFAVLDSTGAAALFETAGRSYWKFDANDPDQTPSGYIVRTNFSINGGGNSGIDRYQRAVKQVADFISGDSLNFKSLVRYHTRDFSDPEGNPIPIPYYGQWLPGRPFGYIYCGSSICRYPSVSAVVIQGVLLAESARLSTMWTILGNPATSVVLPFWPVGDTTLIGSGIPSHPICDAANRIKSLLFDYSYNSNYLDSHKLRNPFGDGLWLSTFPLEDSVISRAKTRLESWRISLPDKEEVLNFESELSETVYSKLREFYRNLAVISKAHTIQIENSRPFLDESGEALENGDIVHILWTGEDGRINPPVRNIGSPDNGLPTGDDILLGEYRIGAEDGLLPGKFSAYLRAWSHERYGRPVSGDLIYLRAFNSDNRVTASCYGDAQLYSVRYISGEIYDPVIKGDLVNRELVPYMMSFSAEETEHSVKLTWVFKREVNNTQFRLERALYPEGPYMELDVHPKRIENPDSPFLSEHSAYFCNDYSVQNELTYYYKLKVIDILGRSTYYGPLSFTPRQIHTIAGVELFPNFPNPFNGITRLRFQITAISNPPATVTLTIYNTIGEEVKRIAEEKPIPGSYEIVWNGRDNQGNVLPSGVYFAILKMGNFTRVQKLILCR